MKTIFENSVQQLVDYINKYKLKSLILGISGGIDSTVCAAICEIAARKTQIPLIGRSLPTNFNKNNEKEASVQVGNAFCNDFKTVCVTGIVSHFILDCTNIEGDLQTPLANGNIQARTRMIYLYNLASIHKGIVIDTDNLSEHYLGYWTLHGDVGDYKPIGHLWKTQVFELAKYLFEKYKKLAEETKDLSYLIKANAIHASLKLKPTAGLGITDSDLDELGAESYEQVDEILQEVLRLKENGANKNTILETLYDNSNINYDIINNVVTRHFNSEFKRK